MNKSLIKCRKLFRKPRIGLPQCFVFALIFSIVFQGFPAPLAQAAPGVPNILSYQGRLTDASGNLLGAAGGTTYYFKFSIWDNSTVGLGNRLWPISAPGTISRTVRQGVFHANIGDTANGFPDTLNYDFSQNSSAYLQVEVSSDNTTFETLAPRQQITSSAFAQTAGNVRGTGSSSFGTTTSIDNSIVTVQATSSSAVGVTIRAALGQAANLFQIQDSSANHYFSVKSNGGVFASSTLQVTGDTRIYGGLTVGSLNGPLQANNGVISATSSIGVLYGGTGLTSAPTFGQILVGNALNGYTLTSTSSLGISLNDTTGTLSAIRGGTGFTTYAVGDILYADTTTSLTRLARGSNGTVLKLSGGVPTWGVDLTSGGGGAGAWATSSDNLSIYPADTADVVLIGTSATSTTGNIFEVVGNALIGGNTVITGLARVANLISTGSTTLQNFTALNSTTTNATSTSLYLSAFGLGSDYLTDITGSGLTISGGALTLNLSGTTTTALAEGSNLYYTPARVIALINSSSTIPKTYSANVFTNANTFNGALTVGTLNGPLQANNGVVSATSSIGVLYGGTGSTTLSGILKGNGTGMIQTAVPGVDYIASALTLIGPVGQTTTGPAVTLATSTSITNGITSSLTVVGSGSTLTFTPSQSGTLTAAGGGTGISNPSAAGILLGSYSGGSWQQLATSSLGLLTTNVNEGTNLYYTDARVNSYINASTTIPKTYSANIFTAANTFNGALTIGTLNGPLQANNGVVSATTSVGVLYGGTGQTVYAAGDILYADTTTSLTRLARGIDGSVLKLSGGFPSWGSDATGGGGVGAWATSSNNLFIYPSDTSDVVIIGGNATTTTGNIFEVIGNSKLGGAVNISGTVTVGSLNGPLQANNGVVSATTSVGVLYGGTGLTTYAPGDLLYASSPTALARLATSTGGSVLSINFTTGLPSYVATSSLGLLSAALTSIGPTGQTTTGPAVTLATSTSVTNGITSSLSIVGSGATMTFTPAQSGTLTAPGGGTGISNPSAAGILLGTYAGGSWQQLATSSLGLLTTNVNEGSNLYFTNTRADARVAAGIAGTTTDALAEGSTNLYYTNTRVNSFINGSTTIPKTYTANTFTNTNTYSGSTILNGGLTIGSLNGPLQANNGVVSATTSIGVLYGGTGLTSAPTYGQLLLGNSAGGYTLSATSSLGLLSAALTSIGPIGQTTTGPEVIIATSTSVTNGVTSLLTVVGSGSTLTFTPSQSGTLTSAGGGTGITNPSAAGILLGSYSGGSWQQLATSSLGLLTTNVNEGSNLYFTNARADARVAAGIAATTTDALAEGSTNLYYTQGRVDTRVAAIIAATTTTALAEGSNLYYTDARVNTYINGSTTIPKTYSANVFTNANTFNGALTVGSLNGPLQANGGVVSATTSVGVLYGGTGLTSAPTYGQLLMGNSAGGYTLTATSSLGLLSSAITSLNGLTSATQTFATSTDTNITLSIVSSGSTHTLTPGWTGSLAAGRGGTGINNPTAAGILLGTYAGGGWQQLATSSLGLITTNVNEGSNLYFTNARADARVAAGIAGTTTDALAEGTTNLYWTNSRFDNRLSATTTLPNITTLASLTTTGALNAGSITSGFGAIDLGADAFTTTGLANFGNVLATGSSTLQNFTALNATTSQATSTYFKTATLGVGSDYITDLTGTGLSIASGALTVNASGDWTGTFDGQEGSYYLANSYSTTSADYWLTQKSTTNLSEGTNLYYTDARVNTYINASTTIPKTYTANVFTNANTFNGSLTVGTLNGPLQANNGVVSATSSVGVLYGGTGLTTAPTYGQMLVGNAAGGYTLTATSSLGINSSQWTTSGSNIYYNTGNVGIGTTSPYAKLSVVGQVVASHFTGTSTATSTLTGGLQTAALNVTGSASSTFANGLNLSVGCYAIVGTCIGGSGTVNSGTTGYLPYYAANGTTLTATSSLYLSTAENIGLGTVSPETKLSITGNNDYLLTLQRSNANPSNNLIRFANSANSGIYNAYIGSYGSSATGGSTTRYVDPNGDVGTQQWLTSAGTTHFSLIDDGIRQATVPDTTDFIASQTTLQPVYDKFDMSSVTLSGSATSLKVWAYGNDGSDNRPTSVNIFIGGSWQATTSLAFANGSNTWESATFTGTWSQSDIDNIQVQIYAGASGFTQSQVYAVYVEITDYVAPSGTDSSNLVFGTNETPANAGTIYERMRVTASGNVGIGTTSPYAKLSVVGQVVASHFTGTTTATSTLAGGLQTALLNVTGSATSTFAQGINLAAGCFSVAGTCLSTGGSGITSLGAQFSSALTGASQTFATTSDTNVTLTITSSGSTHTFNPGWTGSLAAGRGGTGITNPTAGAVLVGAYGGGSWQQIATSSLGLLTTNVNEGSNLYYTDARVNTYINASTTIPKTYTANVFTNANTFNGTLTVGSLNGPLQANNGVVSATTSVGVLYGGTGLATAPTYGQLLVGNAAGGYTLTATSSLGLGSQWTTSGSNIYYNTGNVGIGTTSPYAKLSVVGQVAAEYFTATSTTATNYFGGKLSVSSTTPGTAMITLDKTSSTAGTVGIDEFLRFNSSAGATQFGNSLYIVNAPTVSSNIMIGSMLKVEDNTALGNTVRALEVQAHRGTNTLGENTGISAFGRTFGIKGVTEGDAGASFLPAGIFAQTRGTSQGNALRAYSGSITSADLVYVFQDTSAFVGDAIRADVGNSGGTFTGNLLRLQKGGVNKFNVSYNGTTTIGDGTNQAGLQIGYGGICVDNDGSCTASTTGRITAVQMHTANSDLAETYFSDDTLAPGEIVFTKGGLTVGKAGTESIDAMIGVVSTKPGLLLGFDDEATARYRYPIALAGRVPVRVSTEGGAIKPGDKITLSSIDGVGMKLDDEGSIVGIALEGFDGSRAVGEAVVDQLLENEDSSGMLQTIIETDGCYVSGGGELDATVCKKTDEDARTKTQTLIAKVTGSTRNLKSEAAEEAETISVGTSTAQVGTIQVFVRLGYHKLDPKIANPAHGKDFSWFVDAVTNNLTTEFQGAIDMNKSDIINVNRIIAAKWSITEEGIFTAEEIHAKKVSAEKSLEVGTQEAPIGITIYDTATKQPFCMTVTNGTMQSLPGKCEDITPSSAPAQTQNNQTNDAEDPAPSNTSTTTSSGTTNETPAEQSAGETPAAPAPEPKVEITDTPAPAVTPAEAPAAEPVPEPEPEAPAAEAPTPSAEIPASAAQ